MKKFKSRAIKFQVMKDRTTGRQRDLATVFFTSTRSDPLGPPDHLICGRLHLVEKYQPRERNVWVGGAYPLSNADIKSWLKKFCQVFSVVDLPMVYQS